MKAHIILVSRKKSLLKQQINWILGIQPIRNTHPTGHFRRMSFLNLRKLLKVISNMYIKGYESLNKKQIKRSKTKHNSIAFNNASNRGARNLSISNYSEAHKTIGEWNNQNQTIPTTPHTAFSSINPSMMVR